jgi:hypothetical protein
MMRTRIWKLLAGIAALALLVLVAHGIAKQSSTRTILLEVVRNSWDAERDETLVYLRVYSDGFAEADPMRKVDFRNLELKVKELSADELASLRNLLNDPATTQLLPRYARYWGNKDFGFRFDVTISGTPQRKLELVNFQPFLARKEGKPYPKQLEKLGCSVWKLRTEVSGESLEKNWLKGCAELGY